MEAEPTLPGTEGTDDRSWARLTVEVENVRNTLGRTHPLFALRAVLLHGWGRLGDDAGVSQAWTFHPVNPVGGRVRVGGRYTLHIVLPPGPEAVRTAEDLGHAVVEWLGDGSGGRNFRVVEPPVVERRRLAELTPPSGETSGTREPAELEWALDFATPLALRAGEKGEVDGPRLLRLLEGRLAPLGFSPEVEAARTVLCPATGTAPVQVRPWYLERVRWGESHKHRAEEGRSREDLAGWIGPLYLRGPRSALTALEPALRLAEEFHLGKGLHRAQGHCRLVEDRPFFDPRLGSHTVYFAAFDAVREESEADPVLHAAGTSADAAASVHALHDREAWCRQLAADLRTGTYRPAPPRLVSLQKDSGGTRTICLLQDRDRVAQRALLQLLTPVLDRQLEHASHAWRVGRGIETARRLVADAFREGLTWVVESDVAAFFDEIPHPGLEAMLDRVLPRADAATRAALRACFASGGSRGIVQGSPLSPLLANLYLDSFDETLAARGHRLVRYGDDFLILCPTRTAAEQALADAASALSSLGLRLKEEKTALTSFHAGFFFLGRQFGNGLDEEAAEAATLRRTLFIHTPGAWAGQDFGSVVVRKDGALLARVPLERVSDIVFLGAQGVSTWLLHSCARRRIPVTLATAQGWHVQTLVPDTRTHWDLAARQAARHAALGPAGRLAQARMVVEAKLANHLSWLRGLPGGAEADAARAAAHRALRQGLRSLPSAPSVEALRGTEGQAAAAIYPVVNSLALDPAFHSPLRRARQKPDLWNTLYDAASSLLFSRLNLLLRSRGLNPYLGWLHSAQDHYESLVCDLQEPFRARLDRFLLKLVNKRTITPEHFEEKAPQGAPASPDQASSPAVSFRLSREGYRRLVDAWDRELRVRLAGDPAAFGDLLASQVWLTTEYVQRHLPFLQLYRAASGDKELPTPAEFP